MSVKVMPRQRRVAYPAKSHPAGKHLSAAGAKGRAGRTRLAHDPAAIRARFEALFVPEPMSGCWLWLGGLNRGGYGGFRIGKRKWAAHRAAVLIYRGVDLADQLGRQRCDTPPCVNPSHVEPGSPLDNVRDRDSRGRHCIGERHPNSKLTPEAVRALRAMRDETGATYTALGAAFGVSYFTAKLVVERKAWRQVP